MKDRERVFIGSIGAGFVHFSTYPVKSGYIHFVLSPDTFELVGFVSRLIGMMIIGGFWTYLHKEEHNRMKIFQLGIVAPAMVAGLLYANKPQVDNYMKQGTGSDPSIELSLNSMDALGYFIPIAHAQDEIPDIDDEKRRSRLERFLRGFWGK